MCGIAGFLTVSPTPGDRSTLWPQVTVSEVDADLIGSMYVVSDV